MDRYTNINELVNDLKSLGKWWEANEKDGYFKVITKIAQLACGYRVKGIGGINMVYWYSEDVYKAVAKACKENIPSIELAKNATANEVAKYLVIAADENKITNLVVNTNIAGIAKTKYGVDVYGCNTVVSIDTVNQFTESCKKYLAECKTSTNAENITVNEKLPQVYKGGFFKTLINKFKALFGFSTQSENC